MRSLAHSLLILAMTVVVSACAGGSGSSPAAATPQAPSPATTVAASAGTEPSAGAAGGCAAATGTGAVAVTIKDFAFSPATIQAKVGDVIEWSNEDSAPHSAVLDDDSCATDTIAPGASGALVFDAAGTFAYHCGVHPATMKGTIEIAP